MNEKQGDIKANAPVTWVYQPGVAGAGFPWGPHKAPVNLQFEGISLTVDKHEGRMDYRRESYSERFEKMLLAEKGQFFLNPVEPFHKPVGISTHLMVEFARPVIVEPRSSEDVLVTFPLELACAVKQKQAGAKILEIFSLSRSKFTFYGSIRSGCFGTVLMKKNS